MVRYDRTAVVNAEGVLPRMRGLAVVRERETNPRTQKRARQVEAPEAPLVNLRLRARNERVEPLKAGVPVDQIKDVPRPRASQ